METLFSICGSIAMIGWLGLIVAPQWHVTRDWLAPIIAPCLIAAVYVALFVPAMASVPEGGGFGSLAAVSKLFTVPELLLAGWVHYLAFDLFVGAWALKDSQQEGISHWLMIPCLLLTFMAGPIGLLLYFIMRWLARRWLQQAHSNVQEA